VRREAIAAPSSAGLDVDVASDGHEALIMIERRNYALVLLDLQMPRANGFDVVERLRTKDTRPVIIAGTARSMGELFHDPSLDRATLPPTL